MSARVSITSQTSLSTRGGTCNACVQLLRKGAFLHACSGEREGGTPLHEAVATGARETARALLAFDALPFLLNRHSAPCEDDAFAAGAPRRQRCRGSL